MAGSMADNWRKIGSTSADDMAMKICYSVIVQNWAMAVSRLWCEWQQFAPGAFFCPFLRKEDPIWHKIVRSCRDAGPNGFNAGFKLQQVLAI